MSDAHDIMLKLVIERQKTPLILNARETALIVVDMQRYFLSPDSPFSRFLESRSAGYTRAYMGKVEAEVMPHTRALVDRFRALGRPILWTALDAEHSDGRDLSPRLRDLNAFAASAGFSAPIPHRDDAWAGFPAELQPEASEPVLHKTTYGAFASGGLESQLRDLAPKSLVLCGVVTNICVESTAREAVDRGYDVVIADNACAAFSPETHQTPLTAFQIAYGEVRDTETILNALPLPTTA